MEQEYKSILWAYKRKVDEKEQIIKFLGLMGGLSSIVTGLISDSAGASICGTTLIGSVILTDAIDYAKAYMEANLDFQVHGRYTKLED